ncbi:uncharacterized protein EAF01_010102 [Botrytis porri]|uniref:Uncharacterized protein n=1 Tax=Botrytis porri TaxID=87229 RepID=A0A4Z1KC37_9HELO|nr:uncharacterized protein EAF01_010102 [Botrytis porri]KAF7894652.1 hypothetical protein EAF01_010102 [Botrytis porri]TGO81102.1 hypothetical protein BPOR_1350g00020 [Botrytis porri]
MADTIMQETVMQDADMQDTVMQDTVMQDTITQDTTTEDATTAVVPGPVRKVAKMRRSRNEGWKKTPCENHWKPTEKFHLLHLYTSNDNVSRTEDGILHYGKDAADGLAEDMTAESVKHHPGGLLHASDPWFPRTYTSSMMCDRLRRMLAEEDDLAFELEAELNAHYGMVPDTAAEVATIERQRRALVKESARKSRQLEKEEKIQEKVRISGEEHIQNSNEGLRLAFRKVKKPVILDKTAA